MTELLGFKLLKPANVQAGYDWMMNEGLCCMAYGDWENVAPSLLLTEEQTALHKDYETSDQLSWAELDDELIQAVVIMPVMRNLGIKSLFWSEDTGMISRDAFHGATFGITVK